MSQAAFRPHSILGQLSPLAWQHSYFRSPRSCPQPSCRRFAAVPELPGCSVSSGRAESGPAAQSSLIQDRGLRQQQQQQHCSTPTPPQTSWSAGRLASAAVLVSLAWADQAQAGVGESISEFIDARSSLTTALATIAFLLLLVLTAGVSKSTVCPVLENVLATCLGSACATHQVRLPAPQPAICLAQVIYLSFSAWGDRTSESKDRRDAERAERCAQAREHAPC